MTTNRSSNPYIFSFLTSLYISIAGHLVKNLDELLEINCYGSCFIKKLFDIFFSFDSLLNTIIIFIICFIVLQIRMEKMFFKRIKQIYNDLEFKTQSVISTSSIVSDMDSLMEDVGEFKKKKKTEIDSLKSRDAYRKEFVGNVAHELKTPLFSIQGYISNLLDGALRDEVLLKKYFKRADKSVERLTYIVKDLDLITQIESSNLKLNLKSFDIVKLIREIIEDLEINAQKKKINLIVEVPKNKKFIVFADRIRIQQVLINFGSVKGNKEIGIKSQYDKYLIRITDNGEGISDENLPRLFERFFRADVSRSRMHGGSGLGLAIVKHIIDAHNENIFVQSTIGIGSEFSFTLKKK